jgi:hypothetical protein
MALFAGQAVGDEAESQVEPGQYLLDFHLPDHYIWMPCKRISLVCHCGLSEGKGSSAKLDNHHASGPAAVSSAEDQWNGDSFGRQAQVPVFLWQCFCVLHLTMYS